MADSSGTDAAFGFILFLLFLALLGYAAGGVAGSTTGSTAGTSSSLPPLGGSSVRSCASTLTLEKEKEDSTHTLNLKVYVDPMDAGTKCATASVTSGTVKVTLAYTNQASQMVSSTGNPTASVQVNGTDNFCVSAVAETGTGIRVAIPRVLEPCTTTVSRMRPANPPPGFPTRVDDREDEEGY
jgi:hypothetical protein